jgi:hypothetical protein
VLAPAPASPAASAQRHPGRAGSPDPSGGTEVTALAGVGRAGEQP